MIQSLKSAYNVLAYSRVQFYSLLKLTFSIARLDIKSAFSLFYNALKSIDSVINYRNRGVKPLIIAEESKQIDTDRKVFILGSGPSINLIKEHEWNYIKKHDSMGFNLWFC